MMGTKMYQNRSRTLLESATLSHPDSCAIANAELEDLIGMLDLELSDTRDDARASALWRERAQLLEELAGLRTGVGGTYADNRGSASLVPAAYTIN